MGIHWIFQCVVSLLLVAAAVATSGSDIVTLRIGLLSDFDGDDCLGGFEVLSGTRDYAARLNSGPLADAGMKFEIVPLPARTPLQAAESARRFLSTNPCANASQPLPAPLPPLGWPWRPVTPPASTNADPAPMAAATGVVGARCLSAHAALLGPTTAEGVAMVRPVAAEYGVPLLLHATSDSLLTERASLVELGFAGAVEGQLDRPRASEIEEGLGVGASVLRLAHTDEQVLTAMWGVLSEFDWDYFAIVYQGDETGRGALARLKAKVDESATLDLRATASFEPGDEASMQDALAAIEVGGARVVLLLADQTSAAAVMRLALERGMTGRGWTWVGGDWVRELTWARPAARGQLAGALDGVLGVVPVDDEYVSSVVEVEEDASNGSWALAGAVAQAVGDAPTVSGPGSTAWLEALPLVQRLFPGPAAGECAAMHACPCSRTPDIFLPFAEDALGALASAAIDTLRVLPTYAARLVDEAGDPVCGAGVNSIAVPGMAAQALVAEEVPDNGGAAPTGTASALCRFAAVCARPSVLAERSRVPRSRPAPTDRHGLLRLIPFTAGGDRVGIDLRVHNLFSSGGGGLADHLVAAWSAPRSTLDPSRPCETDGASEDIEMAAFMRCPSPLASDNGTVFAAGGLVAWGCDVAAGVDGRGTVGVVYSPGGFQTANGRFPQSLVVQGSWQWLRSVVWPGDSLAVPPDRVVMSTSLEAGVFLAIVSGLILSAVAGHALEAAHIEWLPESGATVLLGVVTGIAILAIGGEEAREAASFDEGAFALVLLPIIIFESGFALDKHPFFSQLGSILAFALVGTLISTAVVGGGLFALGSGGMVTQLSLAEALSFAALISAVDPVATLAIFSKLQVDPTLNALVYGEAVLNDAVAIVLFRTFTGFMTGPTDSAALLAATGSFFGALFLSVGIGAGVAVLCTLVFRAFRPVDRESSDQSESDDELSRAGVRSNTGTQTQSPAAGAERASAVGEAVEARTSARVQTACCRCCRVCSDQPIELVDPWGVGQSALILLFSYGAYSLAESVHQSGIVASLFAGVFTNHYTRRTLSPAGRRTATAAMALLASIAEAVIFFQVGVNVALFFGEFSAGLAVATIVFCIIGRALNTFPIAWALNLGRSQPIPGRYQLIMWHAGLRGAIAYATSLAFPSQHREELIAATSLTIFFTIFVLGGSTRSALHCLRVPTGVDRADALDHAQDAGAGASQGALQTSDAPTAQRQRAQRHAFSQEAKRRSFWKRWLAFADTNIIRTAIYRPEHRPAAWTARANAAALGSPVPRRPARQATGQTSTDEPEGASAARLGGVTLELAEGPPGDDRSQLLAGPDEPDMAAAEEEDEEEGLEPVGDLDAGRLPE